MEDSIRPYTSGVSTQIKIFKLGKKYLKRGEFYGLCESLNTSLCDVLNFWNDQEKRRSKLFELHLPTFNKDNVRRICKENNLYFVENEAYWWDMNDDKIRIKVLDILLKELGYISPYQKFLNIFKKV